MIFKRPSNNKILIEENNYILNNPNMDFKTKWEDKESMAVDKINENRLPITRIVEIGIGNK